MDFVQDPNSFESHCNPQHEKELIRFAQIIAGAYPAIRGYIGICQDAPISRVPNSILNPKPGEDHCFYDPPYCENDDWYNGFLLCTFADIKDEEEEEEEGEEILVEVINKGRFDPNTVAFTYAIKVDEQGEASCGTLLNCIVEKIDDKKSFMRILLENSDDEENPIRLDLMLYEKESGCYDCSGPVVYKQSAIGIWDMVSRTPKDVRRLGDYFDYLWNRESYENLSALVWGIWADFYYEKGHKDKFYENIIDRLFLSYKRNSQRASMHEFINHLSVFINSMEENFKTKQIESFERTIEKLLSQNGHHISCRDDTGRVLFAHNRGDFPVERGFMYIN